MGAGQDYTAGEPPGHSDENGIERPRRWRWLAGALVVLVLGALAAVWLTRERIAGNYIEGALRRAGVPATYEVVRIAPTHQRLRNVVIGNPRRPDMTIAQIDVAIQYRLGAPRLGRIVLTRPRLYGSSRSGKLSFGSLDKVLFEGPSKGPFRLPDLDLAIVDGRGLLETDWGPVGIKLEGRGRLRDGFRGVLAGVMPRVRSGDCLAEGASLYTTVAITDERPQLIGPLRAAALTCGNGDVRLARVNARIDATLDRSFDGGDALFGLESGRMAAGANRAAGLNGTARLTYRARALAGKYNLLLRGIDTPQARAATFGTEGTLRSQAGLAAIAAEGTVDAGGVRLGDTLDSTLEGVTRSTDGTLIAPMVRQAQAALRRQGANSRFLASYRLRSGRPGLSLVIPQASLRGGSGETLLAVSRFQLTPVPSGAPPRLAGNFASGGTGLPRIAARMERNGRQAFLRLSMAEYRAGGGSLAVPQLSITQGAGGALGFSGAAVLSGALPGGGARNLHLPVEGNWSNAGGLSLWRRCTPIRFDGLTLANLTLERHAVTLCPQAGGAILRSRGNSLQIAAGAPSLVLSGRLGATPLRISSGPVGFAYPGALSARQVDVALGPPATASRFRLDSLTARIGRDIAGRFAGTDVRLFAVPLDMLQGSGAWRYAGGRLTIADGAFRLIDRRSDARFEPLVARGATLALASNILTARAILREPASGREVTQVEVRHDLARGAGHADLTVAGLTFDERVQPDTLTRLALGTVANVRGEVTGTGRIDWTPAGVTSSGRFSSASLDFAAAFGPVKGASGTVEFTDLLGMVTAPNQRIRVASINPGIEVTEGDLVFSIEPGLRLSLKEAVWPFLGGTLRMRPTTLALGVTETRRYVLEIEGLDAAKFIERMQLGNVSATGTFDGTMPLVFDTAGGRIEGGLLIARPPGGNVSYVGALTYKDLSAIANFAFDALKSLDYKQMRIAMDGALEGEIVTRVRFDGVKQGTGAKRNFITRRFANLPIQFNVNVRAPFYQLITSFKAMSDPAFIKDPREIGLLDAEGRPLRPGSAPVTIQPSVSEKTP